MGIKAMDLMVSVPRKKNPKRLNHLGQLPVRRWLHGIPSFKNDEKIVYLGKKLLRGTTKIMHSQCIRREIKEKHNFGII